MAWQGKAHLTPGAKTYPGATLENPFGTGVHFRNPRKERRLSSPKGTPVPNATEVHPPCQFPQFGTAPRRKDMGGGKPGAKKV